MYWYTPKICLKILVALVLRRVQYADNENLGNRDVSHPR